MSLIFGYRHLPHRLRRFVIISVGFLGFSLLVLLAVVLSSTSPTLRGLTLGYEISPIAGVFFAACGVSLFLVAKTEVDDWQQQQGAHAYA